MADTKPTADPEVHAVMIEHIRRTVSPLVAAAITDFTTYVDGIITGAIAIECEAPISIEECAHLWARDRKLDLEKVNMEGWLTIFNNAEKLH